MNQLQVFGAELGGNRRGPEHLCPRVDVKGARACDDLPSSVLRHDAVLDAVRSVDGIFVMASSARPEIGHL